MLTVSEVIDMFNGPMPNASHLKPIGGGTMFWRATCPVCNEPWPTAHANLAIEMRHVGLMLTTSTEKYASMVAAAIEANREGG